MARKPKGKKLVSVPEDTVDIISGITRKKGTSVTKFIDDVLRQAVMIDSIGFSTEDMAAIAEVIQVQRVLGGTFVPLEVLNFVSGSNRDEQQKEQLEQKWFDSGRLYGRYIREKFESPVTTFSKFLRIMRWDLNEVSLIQNGGSLKLRCISTSLSLEGTALLSKFIEGAAYGMGFTAKNKEFIKGMILMSLMPEEP